MELKIIKTEEKYELALERLNETFDADVNSPEGDESEILSLLVEKYEDEHYPMGN